MLTIDPSKTGQLDMHQFLLGAVSPRPIAFVSTVSKEGVVNLAPYSFFNAFSSNPPILVFSSNRRGGEGTKKDTLTNIEQTRECVINVVSYSIVQQMAITSVDFAPSVNEFEKAGLTPLAATQVAAPRVKESPVQMECKVLQIIPLGTEGGAGNLIVCQVVAMHVDENVMTGNRIDPQKIDLVGRMGRHWYSRARGEVFELAQPYKPIVMGFDALPTSIRNSEVFTGNDLGKMSSLLALPNKEDVEILLKTNDIRLQKIRFSPNPTLELHRYAQEEVRKGEVLRGVKIAMLADCWKK